ncbi:MAG: sulfotransferase family 2 domain-containing protein [Caldilineaceae bacterium]|nr:sulfotransferase family 2 domain-containing protein [Caldilineaceae bacterium]MCB0121515.1 sulfotransferase family 2 domain-containing protein [Caldilineaceae bacterium]
MIISHQHRYLFIEIPLTGSWAIRKELCAHYDGMPILHKHATYPEFQRTAEPAELDYFVFAAIRHPLDEIVSRYAKLMSDHKGIFSDRTRTQTLETDYSDHEKYKFVHESKADFVTFFRKYHRRPFGDLIDVASDQYDFIIRYECLQEDFAEVLRRLKLEQVRPVPVSNKTAGKRTDWHTYYTPEIRAQAYHVVAPYMKKWGYAFPADWERYPISWRSQLEFSLMTHLRNLYYTHLRYSRRPHAKAVRYLRAWLFD